MRMHYLSLMEVEDHIRIFFHFVPVARDGPGDLQYRQGKIASYSITASPALRVVEAPGAHPRCVWSKWADESGVYCRAA